MINTLDDFETLDYTSKKGHHYKTTDNVLYRDNNKVLALDADHGILNYSLERDFVVDFVAQSLRKVTGYAIYKVAIMIQPI